MEEADRISAIGLVLAVIYFLIQFLLNEDDKVTMQKHNDEIAEWERKNVDVVREEQIKDYVLSNYAEAYEKAVKYKYESDVLKNPKVPRNIYSCFCALENNCHRSDMVTRSEWCRDTLVACLLWMEGKVHTREKFLVERELIESPVYKCKL